jgi:hypothetical protein
MTGQIFDPQHGPTAVLGERGRTLYRILRGNAVDTELQRWASAGFGATTARRCDAGMPRR